MSSLKGRISIFLALFFLTGGPVWLSSSSAFEVTPFYTRQQSPLVQIFGLPAAEDAALVPAGRVDGRLVLDMANNFSLGQTPREQLELDGETYWTTLVLRYGVAKRVELGLDVPYVVHTGGIFDGFIEWFHDTFGFTNDSREDLDRNRLAYRYVRNGETRVDIRDSTDGIGDILLSCGIQLYREDGPAFRSVALRTGLKLPVGESDKLRGSGSTDLSLRLAASDAATFSAWHLTFYGEAGGLLMSKGDVLEDQQRHLVGFGTAGVGWNPLEWLALKAQVQAHTPFYSDSRFNPIEASAVHVTGGFTFGLPGETCFDLGLSEPVVSETAPDASFHLALRKRF